MIYLLKELRGAQRGVGAVEFALTFPIFLLALIGAIELGVSFYSHSGLTHGVNEAARHATIYPTPSDAELRTWIKQRSFGIDPQRLETSFERGQDGSLGDFVIITARYQHSTLTSFLGLPTIQLEEARKAWIQPAF